MMVVNMERTLKIEDLKIGDKVVWININIKEAVGKTATVVGKDSTFIVVNWDKKSTISDGGWYPRNFKKIEEMDERE
jgi:hypothetical protein